MKISEQIAYLDRFFGQNDKGLGDIRELLTRVFSSEAVKYKGISTSSKEFQKALSYSLRDVSDAIEKIRLSGMPPSLEEVLNDLDMKIIVNLRPKLKNIPPEKWEEGERGTLKENYNEIIGIYQKLRDGLVKNPTSSQPF